MFSNLLMKGIGILTDWLGGVQHVFPVLCLPRLVWWAPCAHEQTLSCSNGVPLFLSLLLLKSSTHSDWRCNLTNPLYQLLNIKTHIHSDITHHHYRSSWRHLKVSICHLASSTSLSHAPMSHDMTWLSSVVLVDLFQFLFGNLYTICVHFDTPKFSTFCTNNLTTLHKMGICWSSRDDNKIRLDVHSSKSSNGHVNHCDKLIPTSVSLITGSVSGTPGGGPTSGSSSSAAKVSSTGSSSGIHRGVGRDSSLISSPALRGASDSGVSASASAISRSSTSGHHSSSSHHHSTSHNQTTVIALYTYQAKDEGDLSFRKGDRLLVLDDKDPDWWLAKSISTGERGYIPRNYVVSEALETEE